MRWKLGKNEASTIHMGPSQTGRRQPAKESGPEGTLSGSLSQSFDTPLIFRPSRRWVAALSSYPFEEMPAVPLAGSKVED